MSINSNSVCSTLSPLTLDTSMTDSIRTEDRSGDTTAAATGHLSNDENGSPTGFLAGGCGRPKGSTINSKRGANQRKAMAIFKAARVYKERLEQRRNNNASSRLMNGELSTIIDDAKALYNVDGNVTIHASTIRSRCKRNNLNPTIPQGTPSPMAAIEPYLIEVILQLSRMRCPINASTGLYLANSMIEGSDLAKRIIAAKRKKDANNKGRASDSQLSTAAASAATATDSSTTAASTSIVAANEENHECATLTTTTAFGEHSTPALGSGYWSGFMRRHRHIIRSKRSVKFESKRAEWCTFENFSEMYDHIYEAMVLHGIASKVDTKVLLNKEGSIVEEPTEAFGLPTQYLLQRPDKLIFVDEVGSNTSTTKDGHVGGEKFLCEANGRPQIKAATKDSHFTVLGFTSATGEPVMCAIIFAAQAMCESWVLGFNASATWIGEDNDIRSNSGGLDKRHPQGPVCHVNGKTVPTFCCCSENGSITSELLVDMLRVIDSFEVFDRSDGIAPFLLLDGHGSRFEMPFLKYINSPGTKWNACVGLPYGTSYWQVGDSSEQNGCFKMALTKYKRELLRRKESVGAEFAIDKQDITYIVAQAWANSFARIEKNKKAIAERGWGPLNFNCLLHPEIVSTQYQGGLGCGDRSSRGHQDDEDNIIIAVTPMMASARPPAPGQEAQQLQLAAEQLNLSQGLAGSLIDTILETRIREDARNGVNHEDNRRKRAQTALDVINAKKKRYTAGLLVTAKKYMLGPDVLQNLEERQQQQEDKVSEQLKKKLQEFRLLKRKVTAIRDLNKNNGEEMTVAQLKTMVTWYKTPGDLPLPTTRALLLERLQATVGRGDPNEPELPAARHLQPATDATVTAAAVATAAPEGEPVVA